MSFHKQCDNYLNVSITFPESSKELIKGNDVVILKISMKRCVSGGS